MFLDEYNMFVKVIQRFLVISNLPELDGFRWISHDGVNLKVRFEKGLYFSMSQISNVVFNQFDIESDKELIEFWHTNVDSVHGYLKSNR